MPEETGDILLEQVNPNGNILAIVESNGSNVYFYLHGAPETGFGVRSCWVRNLRPAPLQLDRDSMAGTGAPPLLPAMYCAHPQGAPNLVGSNLSVVWFEQGDAAALFEGDELLAIIPSWSGTNGFDGYARDCIAQSPVAWPLSKTNALIDRVERARGYWLAWDQHPWPACRDAQAKAYEASLGSYTKYFAIDGGKWPPKAMLRFDRPDAIIFATVGVSLRPMPRVELNYDDPGPHEQIEIAMAIDPTLTDEASLRQLGGYISGQSSFPWNHYTFFGEGHTLPCDSMPIGPSGTTFTAVLFTRDPLNGPPIVLPNYRGNSVTVLWMIPITQAEQIFAEQHGSATLLEKLVANGAGHIHRDRREVV